MKRPWRAIIASVQEDYNGFAVSDMIGTIDLSVSPPTISFNRRSNSGSAAVVNGTSIGAGSDSGYDVQVSLRQG